MSEHNVVVANVDPQKIICIPRDVLGARPYATTDCVGCKHRVRLDTNAFRMVVSEEFMPFCQECFRTDPQLQDALSIGNANDR